MICTTCNSEGVENVVLGKTFYYCRTCKVEILSEAPKPKEEEKPWWEITDIYKAPPIKASDIYKQVYKFIYDPKSGGLNVVDSEQDGES